MYLLWIEIVVFFSSHETCSKEYKINRTEKLPVAVTPKIISKKQIKFKKGGGCYSSHPQSLYAAGKCLDFY
jgi:hypothetical protein